MLKDAHSVSTDEFVSIGSLPAEFGAVAAVAGGGFPPPGARRERFDTAVEFFADSDEPFARITAATLGSSNDGLTLLERLRRLNPPGISLDIPAAGAAAEGRPGYEGEEEEEETSSSGGEGDPEDDDDDGERTAASTDGQRVRNRDEVEDEGGRTEEEDGKEERGDGEDEEEGEEGVEEEGDDGEDGVRRVQQQLQRHPRKAVAVAVLRCRRPAHLVQREGSVDAFRLAVVQPRGGDGELVALRRRVAALTRQHAQVAQWKRAIRQAVAKIQRSMARDKAAWLKEREKLLARVALGGGASPRML